MNGCPFHGMCLRDSELGHYQCKCPECYTQDLPNYVCGNDAVTYQSLCHLHQASCLLQKPIIYDYDGYCKKCEVSSFYVPTVNPPNSRLPNSLSSLICSFIFISGKFLICKLFKKIPLNSKYFLIMIL